MTVASGITSSIAFNPVKVRRLCQEMLAPYLVNDVVDIGVQQVELLLAAFNELLRLFDVPENALDE